MPVLATSRSKWTAETLTKLSSLQTESCSVVEKCRLDQKWPPATFQRAVDVILAAIKRKVAIVYIYDNIIFFKSAKQHLIHTEELLRLLLELGMTLKLKKWHFFCKSIVYLGNMIALGRLQVERIITETSLALRYPTKLIHMRPFLGLWNVYRCFAPEFAKIAAPVSMQIKKGEPLKFWA